VDDIEASAAALLSEELDYDWKFPLFALTSVQDGRK
jgi:hypothetical protein